MTTFNDVINEVLFRFWQQKHQEVHYMTFFFCFMQKAKIQKLWPFCTFSHGQAHFTCIILMSPRHDFKHLLRMHTHSCEVSLSFVSEYQAELHSHLRATSQSHTPAALALPLREWYLAQCEWRSTIQPLVLAWSAPTDNYSAYGTCSWNSAGWLIPIGNIIKEKNITEGC